MKADSTLEYVHDGHIRLDAGFVSDHVQSLIERVSRILDAESQL